MINGMANLYKLVLGQGKYSAKKGPLKKRALIPSQLNAVAILRGLLVMN